MILAHRVLLDLPAEEVVAGALPFQDPKVILVLRDPLDLKVLVALRVYRALLAFKVNRVFLDLRVIRVRRVLLDQLVLLVRGGLLVLLERTRLVRSFPITSPR